MRGHPDKLCDLIADSVLDACLQHDPASRVACEVMATHGHIIVAGEITTSAKPDVFNVVRDTLRDVGYDPRRTKSTATSTTKAPTLRARWNPNWLREGRGTPSVRAIRALWSAMPATKRPNICPCLWWRRSAFVTLLEISRMTGVIPDIGPDGKVQVTMEYNGDTPVRITTVVISVQHKGGYRHQ